MESVVVFSLRMQLWPWGKLKGLNKRCLVFITKRSLKAMDDIGVVMTPFGDVVTVSLVVNSYVVDFTK